VIAAAGALLGAAALPACTNAPPRSVAAIHEAAFVLDVHADIAMPDTASIYLGADGRSQVAPDKLAAGGVDAVVLSLAVPPGPRTEEADAAAHAEAMAKVAEVNRRVAASGAALTLARSADNLVAAHEAGTTAIILGFQNARALEGSLDRIDDFYASGVRMFAFNHIAHNEFSDSSRPLFDSEKGAFEPTEEHGGLSDLGRAAVARINDLGALIDVSQSSRAATLEMIALSRTPVIASHSNAKAMSDATRNLSDEEIDRIGETGGVIGVAAFSAYLVDYSDPELKAAILERRRGVGLPDRYAYPYELYWELDDTAVRRTFLTGMSDTIGSSSVGRMVDHIDYIVERIGIDHVAIASDFNHGGGVSGFEDANQAPAITAELVARGYSEADIGKIWGGNFLRVLRAAEAGRAR
jgi:membrane dipeptidase